MSFSITHMRCGVHTLQLAIHDGLKKSRATTILARVRSMAVDLRTPKINDLLKKKGKVLAVLDQETRWGSSFNMVERIIRLKEIIREMGTMGNEKLDITDHQWTQIVDLRDLLKKAYDVTIALQYADITPGKFFRKWTGLMLYYSDHGSLLADEIKESMKRRESQLINSTLLAAICIDVHNVDLLSPEQKEVGQETLFKIYLRMKGIELEEEQEPEIDIDDDGDKPDSDSDEEFAQLRKRAKAIDEGNFFLCLCANVCL